MAALLPAPAAAAAGVGVGVRITDRPPNRGAIGLLVPGEGATVSRREALDALAGAGSCRRGCRVTVFLSLPPPGEHHNVRRYRIAIVGEHYRGLLVSDRTRVPGLVSIFDVAPTVRALERGEEPPVTWRADARAGATLERLDSRLRRAHDSRPAAMAALITALAIAAALAVLTRSAFLGRAALLVGPAALACSLALSALGVRAPAAVAVTLGLGIPAIALAGARLVDDALGWLVAGLLASFLVVLTVWPETSSLASIGPHPDGGGRFYGVTNEVETLLLAPLLVAGSVLRRRWLAPLALLALVTVGWSRAGADGGGVLVVLAGFAVLAARRFDVRLTPGRAVLAAGTAVAAALALTGLDAVLGGSSHVTRAVSRGPSSLAGEIGHRIALSTASATSTWYVAVLVIASLAGLGWIAVRGPRTPAIEALLVALAVSLVVNDTPSDVAGYGALAALGTWGWERTRRGRSVESPPWRAG